MRVSDHPICTRPNISWRSVTLDQLRRHPWFHPLTLPSGNPLDARQAPQHGEHWNSFHYRRLTTSRLCAFIGFFHGSVARKLNVPRSMLGHESMVEAHKHLWASQLPPPLPARDRNLVSLIGVDEVMLPSPRVPDDTWQSVDTADEKFAFSLQEVVSGATTDELSTAHNESDARTLWGQVQEATGLLAVLNALLSRLPGADVAVEATRDGLMLEVGLCPFEYVPMPAISRDSCMLRPTIKASSLVPATAPRSRRKRKARTSSISTAALSSPAPLAADPLPTAPAMLTPDDLPALGASPDAILAFRGSAEVAAVEVKCVCPFVAEPSAPSGFTVHNRGQDPATRGVAPWHVPQLQLEMLCVGPLCRIAYIIYLTALKGAAIFRVERDDAYIDSMLRVIAHLQREWVARRRVPPPDADLSASMPGYKQLVEASLCIASRAVMVKEIAQNRVQRTRSNGDFFIHVQQGIVETCGSDLPH